MAEVTTLPQDTQQELEKVGAADIVIGIPTYNHLQTISEVVSAAEEAATRHFSSLRSVIVVSDAGSTDGTPARALENSARQVPLLGLTHHLDPINKLITAYHGIPGRDSSFRTIFSTAQRLGATACVVLDADLQNPLPERVAALGTPVLDNQFDLVAPCRLRHKYDGTINNGIVYPMLRTLFGKRVRQPLASEYGFSGRLVNHYLEQQVWGNDAARVAVDIWLTVRAICGEFRICQALLSKASAAKQTVVPLSDALAQVVGALYGETERNAGTWQKIRNSQPLATFGDPDDSLAEPMTVNVRRLLESFRLGAQSLQEIWGLLLPPATLLELKKMARQSDEAFRCPDEVWCRIVYDFAVGYHMRVIPRDHLLGALAPLYLGWLASFVLQTEQASAQEAENRLDQLCGVYEAQKSYLISRWRWPDRFRP
jgi:hypothetical protein